ncbi:MAG: DNA gyrase modulator, partial [Sphingomonadales bacterium]
MTQKTETEPLALLEDLIARARATGADAADAVMFASASLAASCRLGKIEDIERSESDDVGLRVMVGQRQAMVSTTDLTPASLNQLAERATAMARTAPEDPYCGLADASLLARAPWPDLDLYDSADVTPEALEDAAL